MILPIKSMVWVACILTWGAFSFAQPLRISGPPVAESLAFAVMAEKAMAPGGFEMEFICWHSPDQARALIAGGRVDAAIITPAAAAAFYHKGMRTKIAGLFNCPLWVVSRQASARPGPFKGIFLFPFGHKEMPELLFNAVYSEQCSGLETLHTGGSLEAVNLLLTGRADHAMLGEPAATMAVLRAKLAGRPLVKHRDISNAWAKKFNGRPLYVSAFTVFGDAIDQPERIRATMAGHALAREWIIRHPNSAMAIARKKMAALAAQAVKDKSPLPGAPMVAGPGDFNAAFFFLKQLYDQYPGAVGGKTPEMTLFMKIQ